MGVVIFVNLFFFFTFFNPIPSYFWLTSPILSLQQFKLIAFSYWYIYMFALHMVKTPLQLICVLGWFVFKFYVLLIEITAVVEELYYHIWTRPRACPGCHFYMLLYLLNIYPCVPCWLANSIEHIYVFLMYFHASNWTSIFIFLKKCLSPVEWGCFKGICCTTSITFGHWWWWRRREWPHK